MQNASTPNYFIQSSCFTFHIMRMPRPNPDGVIIGVTHGTIKILRRYFIGIKSPLLELMPCQFVIKHNNVIRDSQKLYIRRCTGYTKIRKSDIQCHQGFFFFFFKFKVFPFFFPPKEVSLAFLNKALCTRKFTYIVIFFNFKIDFLREENMKEDCMSGSLHANGEDSNQAELSTRENSEYIYLKNVTNKII